MSVRLPAGFEPIDEPSAAQATPASPPKTTTLPPGFEPVEDASTPSVTLPPGFEPIDDAAAASPAPAITPANTPGFGGVTVEEQKSDPFLQIGADTYRGIRQLGGLYKNFKGLGQKIAGNDEGAQKTLQEAAAYNAETEAKLPRVVKSVKDVGSLEDAARYASENVFEQLPIMAPSMLAGGIGGIVGKQVVKSAAVKAAEGLTGRAAATAAAKVLQSGMVKGAAIGAGIGAFPMNTGETVGNLNQATGDVPILNAIATGTVKSALDVVPEISVIKRWFRPGIVGSIGEEPIKQAREALLKKLAGAVFVDGMKESVTEVMQNWADRISQKIEDGQPIDMKAALDEDIDTAAGVWIATGLMGGAGEATSHVREGAARAGRLTKVQELRKKILEARGQRDEADKIDLENANDATRLQYSLAMERGLSHEQAMEVATAANPQVELTRLDRISADVAGREQESRELSFPDVTAQLRDPRFKIYTDAGYDRAEAIRMVKADQEADAKGEGSQWRTDSQGMQRATLGGQPISTPDASPVASAGTVSSPVSTGSGVESLAPDVLQAAGVHDATGDGAAVVAAQIKAHVEQGAPIDAQAIADATGQPVDVGALADAVQEAKNNFNPPTVEPAIERTTAPAIAEGGSISPPEPVALQKQPQADITLADRGKGGDVSTATGANNEQRAGEDIFQKGTLSVSRSPGEVETGNNSLSQENGAFRAEEAAFEEAVKRGEDSEIRRAAENVIRVYSQEQGIPDGDNRSRKEAPTQGNNGKDFGKELTGDGGSASHKRESIRQQAGESSGDEQNGAFSTSREKGLSGENEKNSGSRIARLVNEVRLLRDVRNEEEKAYRLRNVRELLREASSEDSTRENVSSQPTRAEQLKQKIKAKKETANANEKPSPAPVSLGEQPEVGAEVRGSHTEGGEVAAKGEGAQGKDQGAKPPELMTPEEWAEAHPLQAKIVRYAHPQEIVDASRKKSPRPLLASAVDQYGIKLPEGYVRQGDRYVYQPKEAATPPASTQLAKPEATGKVAVGEKELNWRPAGMLQRNADGMWEMDDGSINPQPTAREAAASIVEADAGYHVSIRRESDTSFKIMLADWDGEFGDPNNPRVIDFRDLNKQESQKPQLSLTGRGGEGEGVAPDYNVGPVWHGTQAQFDSFRSGKFGIHFGNEQQAQKASKGVYSDKMNEGGRPRVIKAYLSLKNPWRYPYDVNAWDNIHDLKHAISVSREEGSFPVSAEAWIAGVEKHGTPSRDPNKRNSIDTPEQVMQILRDNGVDGVVYNNEREGDGESFIVFSPAQIKSTPEPPAKPEAESTDSKEPWQMTQAEIIAEDTYGNRTDKGNWTDARKAEALKTHQQEVQIAIREGKPVPAEVLADYPDLSAPTKAAQLKEKIAKRTQKAGDERTVVGVNQYGVNIEKDHLGARSILDNGFRKTQPVQIVPGMGAGAGILTPEELFKTGRTEFLTAEELAKFKGESSKETISAPLAALRHHVTGAIERGEKEAIVEQPPAQSAPLEGKDDKPEAKWKKGQRIVITNDGEFKGRHGVISEVSTSVMQALFGPAKKEYGHYYTATTDAGAKSNFLKDGDFEVETEKAESVTADPVNPETGEPTHPAHLLRSAQSNHSSALSKRRQAASRKKEEYRRIDTNYANAYQSKADKQLDVLRQWAAKNPEAAAKVEGLAEALNGPKPAQSAPTASGPTPSPAVKSDTIGETVKVYHTKRQRDVWVVPLNDRVSREDYVRFKNMAVKLSGDYSKKWHSSPAGFMFDKQENAEKFRAEATGSTAVEKESTGVEESKPLTTTLRDGTTVLAKMYDGSPSAVTYANRTQAEAAATKYGGEVYRTPGGVPFYIRMPADEAKSTAAAFVAGGRGAVLPNAPKPDSISAYHEGDRVVYTDKTGKEWRGAIAYTPRPGDDLLHIELDEGQLTEEQAAFMPDGITNAKPENVRRAQSSPKATEADVAAMSDDDIDALLDEAKAEAFPTQDKSLKEPPKLTKEPTKAEAIKARIPRPVEAAKQNLNDAKQHAGEAFDAAAQAIRDILGNGGRLGMGVPLDFDADTYAKVKPHLKTMWESSKAVGHDLKQFAINAYKALGEAAKPYLKRFMDEIRANALDAEGGQGDNINGGNEDENAVDQRQGSSENGNTPNVGGETEPAGDGDRGQLVGNQPEAGQGVGGKRGTPGKGSTSAGTGIGKPISGEESGNESSGGSRGVRDVRAESQAVANYSPSETDRQYIEDRGDKRRFKDAIVALKLLQVLRAENRQATPAEQAILFRYPGWGGLKGAFSDSNKAWAREYEQLRQLIDDGVITNDQYAAMRASIQDAHYTSPTVITHGLHAALERFGFSGGRMVEGGSGIGLIQLFIPDAWKNSTSYVGIERDPITSEIAKHLLPQADIHNSDFQKAVLSRGSYDASAGNPPFGSNSLYFSHNKAINKFSLHNQFIAEQIELLRPGGIGAFVVSRYFLDAKDPSARNYIAKKAAFLGAIRLPNTAFKGNAATEVTTDLVFFQRLPEEEKPGKGILDTLNGLAKSGDWLSVGEFSDAGGTVSVNQWMLDHPEMMLGTPSTQGKLQAGEVEFTLEPRPDQNLASDLDAAVSRLPENIYQQADPETVKRLSTPIDVSSELPEGVKIGTYFVGGKSGRIYRRLSDVDMKPRAEIVDFRNATAEERATGIIKIRDILNRLVAAEMDDSYTERGLNLLRHNLNNAYDAFVKKHGLLNNSANKQAYRDSDDIWRVFALERDYDAGMGANTKAVKEGREIAREPSATKAAIFTRRVNAPYREITSVNTSKESLSVSLNQRGEVDLKYMAKLSGKSQDQIISDLRGEIYLTPEGWQQKARAGSGDVRRKHNDAEAAAKGDPGNIHKREYADFVKAQIPKDISYADIAAPIGAPWIDPQDYSAFAVELTEEAPTTVQLNRANGGWYFKHRDSGPRSTQQWGTQRAPFGDLMYLMMNRKPVVIYDTWKDANGTERKEVNQGETELANAKATEIRLKFDEWLWRDVERRARLHRVYNDTYNNYVEPKYDGAHLELPGVSQDISLRTHQKNVIWRTITDLRVLYDHVVGAGKTFAGIASFMEMKRIGRVRKPLFVVPNHLVRQWRDEFVKLYPNANILATEPSDFKKENRQKLFGKILTGEFDAVIVGHSSFKKIGMSPESEAEFLNEQLAIIEGAIRQAEAVSKSEGKKKRSRTQAQYEKMRDSIKAKLQALADRTGDKDTVASFEELGIGGMFVDEYHELGKNLFYTTQMQNVAGLGSPRGSGKAFDLYMKTRYLGKRYNGKAPIVFATGTPISNSMVEMFTLQRYLQGEQLERMGLRTLDAWAAVFGKIEPVYEVDPSGTRYRLSTRFREFGNVGDLAMLYRTVADVVTNEDLQAQAATRGERFPIPKVKGGKPQTFAVQRSDRQADYFEAAEIDENGNEERDGDGNIRYKPWTILGRINNLRNVDPTVDNMLKITNDARKSGLDHRLIDPGAPDNPDSKVNKAVDNILRIHKQWNKDKGTQLVFCDLSVPSNARDKIAQTVYYRDDNGNIEQGSGRGVKMENAPEWAEVYAIERKGKSAEDSGWIVVERNTGHIFSADHKRSAAVKQAQQQDSAEAWERIGWKFERMGELTQDEIEAWEEQNEDKVKDDDAVSLDEILAAESEFSVYDDVKAKLVEAGIPANQVAFIHDFDTPAKKQKLFDAVNRGDVRILMGSTPKMGAGMNVQKRLVALHHLDAPWRPSDLEQREGRIIRQGNMFYEDAMKQYASPSEYDSDPNAFAVEVLRYGTELTYDTRMWQIIEHKAIGIIGFRKADRTTRTLEDIGGEAANAADMKAAISGDPRIQREIELRNERSKLEALRRAWLRNQGEIEDRLRWLDGSEGRFADMEKIYLQRIELRNSNTETDDKGKQVFRFELAAGKTLEEKKGIAKIVGEVISESKTKNDVISIGRYRGFNIRVIPTLTNSSVSIAIDDIAAGRKPTYSGPQAMWVYDRGDKVDDSGFIQRIDNYLNGFEAQIEKAKRQTDSDREEAQQLRSQVGQTFKKQEDLERVQREHEAVKRDLMNNRGARNQSHAMTPELDTEGGKDYEATHEQGSGSTGTGRGAASSPLSRPQDRGRNLSRDGERWERELGSLKSGVDSRHGSRLIDRVGAEHLEVDHDLGATPEYEQAALLAKSVGLSVIPTKGTHRLNAFSGMIHAATILVNSARLKGITVMQVVRHEIAHAMWDNKDGLLKRIAGLIDTNSEAYKTYYAGQRDKYETAYVEAARARGEIRGASDELKVRLDARKRVDEIVKQELVADFSAVGLDGIRLGIRMGDAFGKNAEQAQSALDQYNRGLVDLVVSGRHRTAGMTPDRFMSPEKGERENERIRLDSETDAETGGSASRNEVQEGSIPARRNGQEWDSLRIHLRNGWKRKVDAQREDAKRNDPSKFESFWKDVDADDVCGETEGFKNAFEHFERYGYDVVPVKTGQDMGACVNHDTRTVFIEMQPFNEAFDYYILHETGHILNQNKDREFLNLSGMVKRDAPGFSEWSKKLGRGDDYAAEEIACAYLGGMKSVARYFPGDAQALRDSLAERVARTGGAVTGYGMDYSQITPEDRKTDAERQLLEILGIHEHGYEQGSEQAKADAMTKLADLKAKIKTRQEAAKTKQAEKINEVREKAGLKPLERPTIKSAVEAGKAIEQEKGRMMSIEYSVDKALREQAKEHGAGAMEWLERAAERLALLDRQLKGAKDGDDSRGIIEDALKTVLGDDGARLAVRAAKHNVHDVLRYVREVMDKKLAGAYRKALAKVFDRYFAQNEAIPNPRMDKLTDEAKAKATALLDQMPRAGKVGVVVADLQGIQPDTLKRWFNEWREIMALNQLDREVRIGQERHLAAKASEMLIEELSESHEPMVESGVRPKNRGTIRDIMVDFYANQSLLAQRAFGGLKSLGHQLFYKSLESGENEYKAQKHRAQSELGKELDRLGVSFLQKAAMMTELKPVKADGQTILMTDAERMHLAAFIGVENEGKITGGRLIAKYHILRDGFIRESLAGTTAKVASENMPALVADIIKTLTPTEKAIVKKIIEIQTGMGEAGNRVSRQLLGRSLFTEDWYMGMKPERVQEINADELGTNQAAQKFLENSGFTKTVVEHTHPIKIGNIFAAFDEHVDGMSRYIGLTMPLRNIRTAMKANDSALTREINSRIGTDWTRRVTQTMMKLAGAKNQDQHGPAKMLATLSGNVMRSLLAWNPSSYFNNRVPGAIMLAAAIAEKHPKAAAKIISGLAVPTQIKTRLNPIPLTRFGEENERIRAYLMEHGYLGDRWDDDYSSIASPVNRDVASQLKGKAQMIIRHISNVALNPMMHAEIRNGIDAFKALRAEGLSEERARELVAEATRATQNSSSVLDDSAFIQGVRDFGLGGLFPFLSQNVVTRNFLASNIADKDRAGAALAVAGITASIAGTVLFRSLMRSLRNGPDDDKDKAEEERVINSINQTADTILPGIGMVVEPMLNAAFGQYRGGGSLIFERQLGEVSKLAGKIASGKPVDADAATKFIKALTQLLGLPTGGVYSVGTIAHGMATGYEPGNARERQDRTHALIVNSAKRLPDSAGEGRIRLESLRVYNQAKRDGLLKSGTTEAEFRARYRAAFRRLNP